MTKKNDDDEVQVLCRAISRCLSRYDPEPQNAVNALIGCAVSITRQCNKQPRDMLFRISIALAGLAHKSVERQELEE